MKCPECGTNNPDDSLFCQNCGVGLRSLQTEESKEHVPPPGPKRSTIKGKNAKTTPKQLLLGIFATLLGYYCWQILLPAALIGLICYLILCKGLKMHGPESSIVLLVITHTVYLLLMTGIMIAIGYSALGWTDIVLSAVRILLVLIFYRTHSRGCLAVLLVLNGFYIFATCLNLSLTGLTAEAVQACVGHLAWRGSEAYFCIRYLMQNKKAASDE